MNTQKTKNDTVPIIGYRRPRNDKRKLKKRENCPNGDRKRRGEKRKK